MAMTTQAKRQQGILIIACVLALTLSACTSPKNVPGESLTQEQASYLQELFTLDADESIITYNDSYKFKTNGSFYTDKRVAGYWVGEDKSENNLVSVYYTDIKSMTLSDLSGSLRNASFILITKKNGRSVQVFVDGKSKEVASFYDGVQRYWMGVR